MNSEISLTAHQRTAPNFRFDLATGYPRISGTASLWADAQSGYNGEDGAPVSARMSFINASALKLGIPPHRLPGVKVIPTGSIGLDRAFRALDTLSFERGFTGVYLLLVQPSIDIYGLMAGERKWQVSPVLAGDEDSSSVLLRLLRGLAEVPENLMPVVLAASPANPTGWIFEGPDIRELSVALGATSGMLVLDHCFLTAGVHYGVREVPSIWDDSLALACDWIGLWDTGKTLGLGGKKLGILVPSSAAVSEALDDSIDVLQGEIDEDLVQSLARLLVAPSFDVYCGHLASICRKNLNVLTNMITPTSGLRVSGGSTFALLGSQPGELGSKPLAELAAGAEVSVAAGHHFVTGLSDSNWLRLSLAREPSYFAAAIANLLGALGAIPGLLPVSARAQ